MPLAACDSISRIALPPATEIRDVMVAPPAALLDCAPDVPVPPDEVLATWTQRDVAELYVRTWAAGEDCRRKLTELKLYLRDARRLSAGGEEGTP